MGYMAHHAVLITINGYAFEPSSPQFEDGVTRADIEAFREHLPEKFRRLLIGPIESASNNYYTFAFLPDGSKEDWDVSEMGDLIRARLIEMFSFKHEDGSSPYDVVEIRYGGDDPGEAAITHQNRDDIEAGGMAT